jgi:hypothetical protein
LLKDCGTPKDLLDKQRDEIIKKMKPEILLTLAGIKILKE